MSEKKMTTFAQAGAALAKNGWGKPLEEEALVRHLVDKGVGPGDAAMLDLMRMVHLCLDAILSKDRDKIYASCYGSQEPPEYALVYPDAKVGDIFYTCNDVFSGVTKEIVTFVDEEQHIVTTTLGSDSYHPIGHSAWAGEGYFLSVAEALEKEAKDGVEYHKPRADYAQKVLDAIREKADLTQFMDGNEELE